MVDCTAKRYRAPPLSALGSGASLAAIGLGYFLAFLTLYVAARVFTVRGDISICYPPAGLLLAFLLRFGWRAVPVTVAVEMASAVLLPVGHQVFETNAFDARLAGLSALVAAAIPSACYGVAVWVAGRSRSLPLLPNLHGVLALCAIAVIGAVSTAALYCALLVATGEIGKSDHLAAMVEFATGDLAGILMLTPVLLFVLDQSMPAFRSRVRFILAVLGVVHDGNPATLRRHRRLLTLGLAITTIALVSFALSDGDALHWYPIFLPVTWAALSFGLSAAAITIAAVNVIIAVIVAVRQLTDALPAMQMFVVVVSMTGLAMGAVVSELRGERQALRRLLRQRTEGLAAEIGRRREAQAVAIREGERAQKFLTITPMIIVALDRDARVTLINPEGCRVLGYPQAAVVGRDFFAVIAPQPDRPKLHALYRRYLNEKAGRPLRRHGHVLTRDGQLRIIDWRFVGIRRSEHGIQAGVLCSGNDVTERVHAKQRIQYLANHDGLTGLPNRRWLCEALSGALARARRHRLLLAVLFIDLDGFKPINDRHGHAAGDAVLVEAAQRLRGLIREADIAARFGGDEFVVVIEDLAIPAAAAQVAAKILAAFSWPVEVASGAVRVGASIGIAVYPSDGHDTEALLRAADRAMYRIKNTTPGHYTFADDRRFPSDATARSRASGDATGRSRVSGDTTGRSRVSGDTTARSRASAL